jgi:ABC-2 type transport system ATP-binding protein
MSSTEPMIETRGLDKYFGKFQALSDLDLTVTRGEVHGFLGPNGAGKSTTIRVLLGLLKRDGGDVQMLGGDPWSDATELHKRLAYVPGDVTLWPGMSGGEAIDLLGALRGGLDDERRAHLLDRFELDPTKKGRQYSKGNRQKVALVAALASDAELLILDEPTSGLDPLMENVFQEEVAAAVDRGATVLLSSHILAEVENLADRVSIIRDGHMVRTGTLDELRGDARTTVHATLDSVPESGVSGLHDTEIDGNHLTATVDPADLGDAMTALSSHGITTLSVEPPSLEALFLGLYGEEDVSDSEGAA